MGGLDWAGSQLKTLVDLMADMYTYPSIYELPIYEFLLQQTM
jgi:hypothetical protein